jgi:hypothetical protein
MQFFGLNKFRLGRILWARHRTHLPRPGAADDAASDGAADDASEDSTAADLLSEAAAAAAAAERVAPKGGAALLGAGQAAPNPAPQEMTRPAASKNAGPEKQQGQAGGKQEQQQHQQQHQQQKDAASADAAKAAGAAADKDEDARPAPAMPPDDPDSDGAAQHTALFSLWVGVPVGVLLYGKRTLRDPGSFAGLRAPRRLSCHSSDWTSCLPCR